MINPITLPPFKRVCLTIGEIPSTYIESLTYIELLTWLCNFIENTVIPSVNNNAEALKEVQEKFNELQNYINNYFTNLDVQQEINNKLDQMAEDGEIQDFLIQYVAPRIQEFQAYVNSEIANINSKVNAAASGGPAGTYNTLTDLDNADPDHSKIYLVKEDNSWYYYNTTSNEWDLGGDYLTTDNTNKVNILNTEINKFKTIKNIGYLNEGKLVSSSGGQIQISNNTHFNYLKINLNEIETNELNQIKATFLKTQYLYFIIYTNGLTIIKQDQLHTADENPIQMNNYVLDIPSNCTNIYINGTKTGPLNATLSTLEDTVNAINNIENSKRYTSIVERYRTGYFSSSANKVNFHQSINYICAEAPCLPGDNLQLSFFASQYLYYIFLCDNNYNVKYRGYLNTSNQYQYEPNYKFIVPFIEGVTKICVSSRINYPCDIKKLKFNYNFTRQINCWGDSLTDGSGSSDQNGFISYLRSYFNIDTNINNFGIAGQNTQYIAYRRGAYDLYVKPTTLSATNDTTIEIVNEKLNPVTNLFLRGGELSTDAWLLGKFAINPVQIGNTTGFIKQQQNGTYTYTIIKGSNYTFNTPQKINITGETFDNNIVDIIWAGTNDLSNDNVNNVINIVNNIVNKNKSGNYLILGFTANNNNTTVYNNAFAQKYGDHFLDLKTWLINYGLMLEQITPTEQDQTDIANGQVPSSLLANDKLHFNNQGYEAIAKIIYQKGQLSKLW